jgi:hypothetical protein
MGTKMGTVRAARILLTAVGLLLVACTPAPAPPTPEAANGITEESTARDPAEPDVPMTLNPDDLGMLVWETDCTDDASVRRVRLEPVDPDKAEIAPMRPGGLLLQYVSDPTSLASVTLTVDLSVIARVDLDGDGREELAVSTSCFVGNGFMHAIEVWGTGADGSPVQLPSPLVFGKTDGYVIDLAGDVDALVVTMRVGAVGDEFPHLNGYPRVRVTEHRFDGAAWTMSVRSLEDAGTEP